MSVESHTLVLEIPNKAQEKSAYSLILALSVGEVSFGSCSVQNAVTDKQKGVLVLQFTTKEEDDVEHTAKP